VTKAAPLIEPNSGLDVRGRLAAMVSRAGDSPCPDATDLIAYAHLAAAPPDAALFSAHLVTCARCRRRWGVLQGDGHPTPGEMLAVVRQLLPGVDDARFFERRLRDHVARCAVCQQGWAQAQKIFEIAPGVPASVSLDNLVQSIRRAGRRVTREGGGERKVAAAVLQHDRTLSMQDGVARTTEAIVRAASIGLDGTILILVDLSDADRTKYQSMQAALQAGGQAVMLPEVQSKESHKGHFEIEMNTPASGKHAVEIAPENIWLWFRE
jgi:hypothetical protein